MKFSIFLFRLHDEKFRKVELKIIIFNICCSSSRNMTFYLYVQVHRLRMCVQIV